MESVGTLRHGHARRGSLITAPNITCDILSPQCALCTGRLRGIHWHRLKYAACWGYRWWRGSGALVWKGLEGKVIISDREVSPLLMGSSISTAVRLPSDEFVTPLLLFFLFLSCKRKPVDLFRPRSWNSRREFSAEVKTCFGWQYKYCAWIAGKCQRLMFHFSWEPRAGWILWILGGTFVFIW